MGSWQISDTLDFLVDGCLLTNEPTGFINDHFGNFNPENFKDDLKAFIIITFHKLTLFNNPNCLIGTINSGN